MPLTAGGATADLFYYCLRVFESPNCSSMSLVMVLDEGAAYSRAVVDDEGHQAVAFAQNETEQTSPQPVWVEKEPLSILINEQTVADEALGRDEAAERMERSHRTDERSRVWAGPTGGTGS